MIYDLGFCYEIKGSQGYSKLICFLLWMSTIFDSAMTTRSYFRPSAQSTTLKIVNRRFDNSAFCNENRKSLLSYRASDLEILSSLSSKYGPSSTINHHSSSSSNISLPQVSPHNVTFIPHFRMDSYTLLHQYPLAGCISLLNYYWTNNGSLLDSIGLFGIKIFIFHIDNNSNANWKIDLRILLDSSRNMTFFRPVVIVLSSIIPRRFSLSMMSYLARTQHPIHIILTTIGSELIMLDTNLRDSDIARLSVSVLDSSYSDVFKPQPEHSSDNDYVENIRNKWLRTNLHKYGHFSGFRYNSISVDKTLETLWLFDNMKQFSSRVPDIRLVAVYMVDEKVTLIDLVLGKPEPQQNPTYNNFYDDQCTIVNIDNYRALSDRILTLQRTYFLTNKDLICSYYIKPKTTPPSSLSHGNYQTVTWLHFQRETRAIIHLTLTSDRFPKPGEKYLMVLTADNMKLSMICIESYLLHKQVDIVSNISLEQFDQRCRYSSRLISLDPINSDTDHTQSLVANYISASSSAVMQTTIYKLYSNRTYEIKVNVDDSQVYSYSNVIVNVNCLCYSKFNGTLTLSIDLRIWKHINTWTPTQFQFSANGGVFDRINDSYVTFTTKLKVCSDFAMRFFDKKIYGIWRDKKYLFHLPFDIKCKSLKKLEIWTEKPDIDGLPKSNFIVKSEYGFYIFNDSKFRNPENPERPFHDKDRIFVELAQNVAGQVSSDDGIQLRDCYLTDRMASVSDLEYSNQSSTGIHKLRVIKGGCINQHSPLYADMESARRPMNHSSINFFAYKFSFGVDAEQWASELSLRRHWNNQSRMEVHLYCGVNRCYANRGPVPLPDDCVKHDDCTQQFLTDQFFVYYGSILILRTATGAMEISVLTMLSIVTCILFIALIVFLWRVHQLLKCRYKYNRSIVAINWRTSSANGPRSEADATASIATRVDYVRLVKMKDQLYESPVNKYTSFYLSASSGRPLLMDMDKSMILEAGYMATTSLSRDQAQNGSIMTTEKYSGAGPHPRGHSHSTSECDRTTAIDRGLYSWPLSSIDRARSSCHSKPTSSRNHQYYHQQPHRRTNHHSFKSSKIRDHRYWLTWSHKLKVSHQSVEPRSFTYLSNPKLSSNRTTMSVESASAGDVVNNTNSNIKSCKWWSPMLNCSINRNLVTCRN